MTIRSSSPNPRPSMPNRPPKQVNTYAGVQVYISQREEQQRKDREARRQRMQDRIRGRRLQAIRARMLHLHPLCCMCKAMTPPRITASTEIDHIIPLCQGGTDTDDNRQALCTTCHAAKTAQEATHRARNNIQTTYIPKQQPTFTLA